MKAMAFAFWQWPKCPTKWHTFKGHLGLCALSNKIQPSIYRPYHVKQIFVWPWCPLKCINVPWKLKWNICPDDRLFLALHKHKSFRENTSKPTFAEYFCDINICTLCLCLWNKHLLFQATGTMTSRFTSRKLGIQRTVLQGTWLSAFLMGCLSLQIKGWN